MDIAILDPSAGIGGDMTLGALLDIGVERSKGRIGFRVEVHTPQGQEGPILEALFRHSSAGARSWTATRKTPPRHFIEV